MKRAFQFLNYQFIIFCILFSFNSYSFPLTPHPTRSPGHLCDEEDKDFHKYRYSQGIPYCKRNVSKSKRYRIYRSYGIPWSKRKYYNIDHIIPLSIGGSNSKKNLWPEHKSLKRARGSLEFRLFKAVRDGFCTQEEAVEIILDSKFRRKKFRRNCLD